MKLSELKSVNITSYDRSDVMPDVYVHFYRKFLQEMPMVIPGENSFDDILTMLAANLSNTDHITKLANNIFKLNIGNQTIYWNGSSDLTEVNIIVDTFIVGNFCKVVFSSKNPNIKEKSPYASDMYLTICDDMKQKHLIFTSDKILSYDGKRLWQGLVNRGNHVAVYDTKQKEYVLNKVENEAELLNYLGDDEKQRYVFVLSENSKIAREPVIEFTLMEIKRENNWPLLELFLYK